MTETPSGASAERERATEQRALLDTLSDLADRGTAVVVAIHDLRAAVETFERLIVMQDRRVVADAAPPELMASGKLEEVFRVPVMPEGRRSSP